MDNFEKYLKENKAAFDAEFENKHQVWSAIEQKIAIKKKIILTLFYREVKFYIRFS